MPWLTHSCITDQMWGTVATGLPSCDGRPTYERLDLGDVVDRAGAATIPPILSADGKHDHVVGWAEKARFYKRMQQQRRGGRFFWAPEEHQVVGLGYWQPMIDMSWLYRHRNDRSFPVFSNCDLDSDPGDGSFASGDSWRDSFRLCQRRASARV